MTLLAVSEKWSTLEQDLAFVDLRSAPGVSREPRFPACRRGGPKVIRVGHVGETIDLDLKHLQRVLHQRNRVAGYANICSCDGDGQRVTADGRPAKPARQWLRPGMEDAGLRSHPSAPEAMGIRFHEVRAKIGAQPGAGRAGGFGWTVNPYRGCNHACVLLLRPPHPHITSASAGRDFDREIVVGQCPEVVRAELARPSWKRELVALGTNTDLPMGRKRGTG